MACQQLGWSEVPTIRLDHLTEAQARAFMIADNRLTENSVWDDRLLAEQLEALATMDLDFSLEVTGFEIGEIDLRIEQQLSSATEEGNARADRLPEAVNGPSVTRPGDLWLLNEHRVLCGSALEQIAYASLMKNSRATMVFTDPPFNVRIGGNVSGSGGIQHREFAMASGELSEDEFRRFLSKACSIAGEIQRHGSPPLCLYGLEAHGRAARRWARGVQRTEKCLCLGQRQRRNGIALQKPARAGVRVQARARLASQKRPVATIRPQPH